MENKKDEYPSEQQIKKMISEAFSGQKNDDFNDHKDKIDKCLSSMEGY